MKLRTYYENTVKLNDEQTGGWSCLYYGVFSNIINENNYKNVAEVGIGYGTHAKEILKNTNVNKLILVDPIKYYPYDTFAKNIMDTTPEVSGNNFNELCGLILETLSPWRDRYQLYRAESLEITDEEVPNESLDCIFIDGDHSYEGVSADLRFWWRKVRHDGQILGDDFWLPSVAKAVDDFATEFNVTYDFLYRENTTYKIFRFHKI